MNSPAKALPLPSESKRRTYKRALTIAAIVALILLATGAALLAAEWPFTPAKMKARHLQFQRDERIDLHGKLRVDTKFSQTATGAKTLLTRVRKRCWQDRRVTEKSCPSK